MKDVSQLKVREAQTDTGAGIAEKLDFDAATTSELDNHAVRDDVANIRCNLPFVSVVPWPKAAFLLALNGAVTGDIKIPDNAVLMKLSALAPFFANILGGADGVTSATTQVAGNDMHAVDQLISALETEWLYVAGLKSISVRSTADNNKIGARFIFRDQI